MRRLPRPSQLVALLFLAVGLLTLDDYGTTWDEPESYAASAGNLRLVADAFAGRPLEWPWHELTGYQFVFDTARGAVAAVANRLAWHPMAIEGFHLFNLLLATGSLLLLAALVQRVTGSETTAAFAAGCLALTPKFVAHSQANPKDLVGLFVIMLGVAAIDRAARAPGMGRALAAGVAAGLALANHVAALVLAPLAALWIPLAGRGALRRRLLTLLLLGAATPAAFILAWPWLWADPLPRLLEIAERVRTFPVGMGVLYLGAVYPLAAPPAHYTVVTLLAATPLVLLVLQVMGAARVARGNRGERRLARLAVLWAGAILLAEAAGSAHYDGVRHVLAVLPPLAVLAGLGATRAWDRWRAHRASGEHRRAAILAGAAALAALGTLGQLVLLHPYHDAYLSEPVRAWVGGEAQEVFELEYWGFTYREAARWLDRHAAPEALVVAPMATEAARWELPEDLEVRARDRLGRPSGRDRYLLLMTRRAWYDGRIEALRARREPVFTIRRQGSTLLEIYRLPASGTIAGRS